MTSRIFGRNRFCCSSGPEGDERGTEQFLAEVVDLVGGIGLGVLLVERDPVRDRQTAAPVLFRPSQTCQPGGGQVFFSRKPPVERLVVAPRSAKPLERGEFADEIVREPVADLGPELLDLNHPCRLTYQALALLEEHR